MSTQYKSTFVLIFLVLVGVGVCLWIVNRASQPDIKPSMVRVLNNTGHDITSLTVNQIDFGTLKAGAASGYRWMPVAYRYAAVHATTAGKTLAIEPDDYSGETPLGEGRFSYTLTLRATDSQKTAQLEIGVTHDN